MNGSRDEWVAAALSDDTLVAELLSRLTQSPTQPPPQQPFIRLPCVWGHRQRRSKPAGKDSGTRRSPTTPLSWSGASDGADCSNSTSSRPPSDLSRSNKGAYCGYGDDVTNKSLSKKKKSFAELKEEESLLLRERVGLKRELASLNSTLKQQRVKGERLKRIKMDLNADDICTTSCRTEAEAASSCYPRRLPVTSREMETTQNKAFFALPDLNMMPSEEEMVSGFS